jgi:hypothetical protein
LVARKTLWWIAIAALVSVPRCVQGQTTFPRPDNKQANASPSDAAPAENAASAPELSDKLRFLPPPIADGLDVNLWGWLGYSREFSGGPESYWDGELQLDINKTFGDRFAITADVNFVDADNHMFGQLEQAFGTVLVSEKSGTLLTVGKFNSSFGVEPRDFWNRATGTTSLLFGAEPQDLIGFMVTQPIGQTGVKVRPFIVNGFDGHLNVDRPPSAGITVEYRPVHEWSFAVTNWVGPGFLRRESASGVYVGDTYGSGPGSTSPTTDSSYSSSSDVVVGNWLGPDFEARRGGTLYFLDAKATWMPTPDFTLAAEGLFGTTGSSDGRASWGGVLLLATYDITDRWRAFGRWSFLNDAQGLVTGAAQRRHELSAGVRYQIVRNAELRAEYRHDFSDETDGIDSVSVHLSFGL